MYAVRVSERLEAVDQYVARAAPFAQPILTYLREAVHRAVPGVEEQMKWSMPFFVYRGVILGNMAAFKQHCSFGLWGGGMAERLRAEGLSSSEGMGTFGKVTAIADLPPARDLEQHIRHAAELIGTGARTKSIQRVAKPARVTVSVPASFETALQGNAVAHAKFQDMSASCRREYVEWIADAKREETRAKRIAEALEWIAEGKNRNWKYERRA